MKKNIGCMSVFLGPTCTSERARKIHYAEMVIWLSLIIDMIAASVNILK